MASKATQAPRDEATASSDEKKIQEHEAEINQHSTQITALKHKICDLKASINTKTPIGRLNEDDLVHIFSYIVSDWLSQRIAPGALYNSPPVRSFHWTIILRVCRRWWSVASTTPQLWTTFSPACPAFVTISLQRYP